MIAFEKKIDFIIQIFQSKFERQTESLTTLHSKVNYMLTFATLLIAVIYEKVRTYFLADS